MSDVEGDRPKPECWPIHLFADVIRARRMELGVSQRELARRVGSTQGHVQGIERGLHRPGTITAKLLADALDLEIIIREREPK